MSALEQVEVQVGIFAPGHAETLIEAIDFFKHIAPYEAVSGDEFGSGKAGSVDLNIRWLGRQWHLDSASHCRDPVHHGRQTGGKPSCVRHRVIVGKGDDRPTGVAPPLVAST